MVLKAYLSTDNLLHNLKILKKEAKGSEVIPVIKGNAYGHGTLEVVKRIVPYIKLVGMSSLQEALMVRQANIQIPIILLQGVDTLEEFNLAQEHNFIVVIHHKKQLSWLKKKSKIWVKFNCGLNRLGFSQTELMEHYLKLSEYAEDLVLLTHLPATGDPDHFSNKMTLDVLGTLNLPLKKTICDSGGIFFFKDQHFDYVRSGIALFGVSSFHLSAQKLNLKPVMTLKTNLRTIRNVKEGDYLGYYFRTQVTKNMRLGIACVGYGDGYPFTAPTGTPFLVNNQICPLIGRVSLDVVMLDITDIDVKLDSEIVVWGDGLPLDEIIKYTCLPPGVMLSSLHEKVERIWIP